MDWFLYDNGLRHERVTKYIMYTFYLREKRLLFLRDDIFKNIFIFFIDFLAIRHISVKWEYRRKAVVVNAQCLRGWERKQSDLKLETMRLFF